MQKHHLSEIAIDILPMFMPSLISYDTKLSTVDCRLAWSDVRPHPCGRQVLSQQADPSDIQGCPLGCAQDVQIGYYGP